MIGNSRTSKPGWSRIAALATFEVRQQLRDPLTALYALVFFFLAFGYTSSDVVELVSRRAGVPKTAPWALALAFGGLVAFGQLITTMISATAILRDDALRARDLIATSGVTPQQWFAGHAAGALAVMMLVYAAIPIGAYAGASLSSEPFAHESAAHVTNVVHSFVVITLPTTVIVALLLTSVGVRTGRVMGVLVAALALVALWQLALTLEGHGRTRVLGALLDPFGNAPMLALSHDWTIAERTARTIGLHGLLLWNRLLWLTIAVVTAVFSGAGASWRLRDVAAATQWPRRRTNTGAHQTRRGALRSTPFTALRTFTTSWIVGDPAWKIVAALALSNALLNVVFAEPVAASGSRAAFDLMAVYTNCRVFLILLATVYAGELIWRERDVRIADIAFTMPVSRLTAVLGRVAGVIAAQSWLALILSVGGLVVLLPQLFSAVADSAAPASRPSGLLLTWLVWSVFVLWLPFVQLTVLSAAVHAIVNHKVFAHLLLITGWVLAVTVNRQTITPWWLQFAEPATLFANVEVAWVPLAQRGAYWSAVSAALVLLIVWRWPTITSRR